MSYIGNEPIVSATRTITEVTATAGQTVFVANGGYTVGYIDVFLNGAQLQTVDFTATNGSSITLTEAAQVGDVLKLVAWGTFQTSSALTANNPSYTGTLTGGTGVVNIGSGQVYKDASGNVGIGTSSPASGYKLHVNGDVRIDGNIGSSANPFVYSWSGGSSGQVRSGINLDGTNTKMEFYTAQAERMRIDSSGNLLVGTTSAIAGKLCRGQFARSDNGAPAIGCFINNTSASNQIIFANPNGEVGVINTTGTSTSYVTSSDYRLKENIAPMTGALAKVAELKPVTYNWKIDGSSGQGFIAHELQAVVPDCVTGEKDAVDAEGNPVYQGIDTSFLVATLTAAIQEQQAIITDLKQRIETLESK